MIFFNFLLLSLLTTDIVLGQNTPQIVNATVLNENQIYLKWEPNRETTENTRYRIEVIYKDESIPSFLYPGCLYYSYFIKFLFNIQSICLRSSNAICKRRRNGCWRRPA
jgi:hypothetical protein